MSNDVSSCFCIHFADIFDPKWSQNEPHFSIIFDPKIGLKCDHFGLIFSIKNRSKKSATIAEMGLFGPISASIWTSFLVPKWSHFQTNLSSKWASFSALKIDFRVEKEISFWTWKFIFGSKKKIPFSSISIEIGRKRNLEAEKEIENSGRSRKRNSIFEAKKPQNRPFLGQNDPKSGLFGPFSANSCRNRPKSARFLRNRRLRREPFENLGEAEPLARKLAWFSASPRPSSLGFSLRSKPRSRGSITLPSFASLMSLP